MIPIFASSRQPAAGFVPGQATFPNLANSDLGTGSLVTVPYMLDINDATGTVACQVYFSGNAAQNQGRMFVTLKPLAERKLSVDQVIARLRPKMSHIPGATLYFQGVQDLQIGGRQSNAQFQYTLSGENLNELYEWAPKLLQQLRKIPSSKT